MYVVRHRGDGTYLAGFRVYCAAWVVSIEAAYRFVTKEDAFATAYAGCITTAPADLEVVELLGAEAVAS